MSYPQQPPAYQPPHPPQPSVPPKRRAWPWILGVIAAFIVGALAGNAAGTENANSNQARETITVGVPDGQPAAEAPAEAPAEPAGPATTMSSGTYQVGVDVQAGQYKTAGPEASDSLGCYWARLRDDSGNLDSIITNQNLTGPGSVTINDGEFVELSGDCTWTKVA